MEARNENIQEQADSDCVSVEEAKRMFEDNPGLSAVLTNSGRMFRDGSFEHENPHLKMNLPHLNPSPDMSADAANALRANGYSEEEIQSLAAQGSVHI